MPDPKASLTLHWFNLRVLVNFNVCCPCRWNCSFVHVAPQQMLHVQGFGSDAHKLLKTHFLTLFRGQRFLQCSELREWFSYQIFDTSKSVNFKRSVINPDNWFLLSTADSKASLNLSDKSSTWGCAQTSLWFDHIVGSAVLRVLPQSLSDRSRFWLGRSRIAEDQLLSLFVG